VPRLTHHRHVDPDYQTGAEALLQYLDQQGYQADWTTASADDYGLPQSRCRVYIVAVRAMPPLHCKHAARKKVSAALSLFRRLCPSGPAEDVEALLKRAASCQQKLEFGAAAPAGPSPLAAPEPDLPSASARPDKGQGPIPKAEEKNAQRRGLTAGGSAKRKPGRPAGAAQSSGPPAEDGQTMEPTAPNADAADPVWPARHRSWAEKRLPGIDLTGRAHFMNMPGLQGLSERCRDVMFLKLTYWSLKNERPWEKEPVIITVPGNSIGWCPIHHTTFPCLTPSGTFVIFMRGQARLAQGFDFLFLQGLQEPEITRWSLHQNSSRALQDLAGNGFTANVVCALLAACLSQS